MEIYEYEFNRNIMLAFIIPIILNLYCNLNNLKLLDIKYYYYIIPILLNCISNPLIYTYPSIYYTSILLNILLTFNFLYNLYLRHLSGDRFIYIYIKIIILTNIITLLNILNIIDKYLIILYYLIIDFIGIMTISLIINDFDNKETNLKNNMNLESVNFVSKLVKYIDEYKNIKPNMSLECKNIIEQINKKLLNLIPNDKNNLQIELLKKILPLNLDKKYIEQFDINNIELLNDKNYNFICVLFTDIVSYTELANKFDEKIIFKLLNKVYNKFDEILNKYPNLQKIETIGDAYMVVGDLYRSELNHQKVIKQIILLAIEFLNNIKLIETPDSKPLELRIGINMGSVAIGILGTEIPRLCVVGNAVNKAARLQSTADLNSIQVSHHVYEQVKEIELDVNFFTKTNVYLKNLGTATTYSIYLDK